MKRILIMFLFLFTCVCVLTVHAGEQVNYKTDELSAVAEDVAELEEMEKRIEQICNGTDPICKDAVSLCEELKKNAEAAEAKIAEIKTKMDETWGVLPDDVRLKLLARIMQDPDVRVSAVRGLCPENVSFVDFAKIVSVGKQYAPLLVECGEALARCQQINSSDAIIEATMIELENAADAKKLAILLKLMEGCPGFNDVSADFPLDELLAPLSALVQRFGWKEKELFEEAENVWFTARPCMSKPGARMVKTVNGIEYAFRWCPAGSFLMGSPSSEPGRFDNETQHRVTLTRGFWMLETEVTQAMWQSVMGNNPSEFKSPTRPVECVSWDDCQEFCRKLSSQLGLTVSLPTEAQWEYACRAGSETALPNGPIEILGVNNAPALDPIAWYGGNSSVGFELSNGYDSSGWSEKQYFGNRSGTHPVGKKKPNAWGLYDMIGNVFEWCQDTYDSNYYAASPTSDPCNEDSGSYRVGRGGSWYFSARNCRSAIRVRIVPGIRDYNFGFRPVLASPAPGK